MHRPQLRQCCWLLIRHAWMRLGCHAPARDRRDRLRALLLGQFPRPPAPQQEAGNAGLLRRQLQTTRGIERQNPNFSDNRAQGPAAQGFLERPAHFRIAPGGNEDQPPQIKPEGGKARRIEIGILRNPGGPSRRRIERQGERKKAGAGRALFLIAGVAGNFMDRAERDGRLTQIGVNGSHPSGKQSSRRA